MTKDAMHEEIDQIVQAIFDDYNGGKNIDAIKLFSNPDKDEVRELLKTSTAFAARTQAFCYWWVKS